MSIIFIDKNKKLCKRVGEVFKKHKDYFQQNLLEVRNGDIREIDEGVFVTASNPLFNPAGGLDAILFRKYPDEWRDLKEGVRTKHLFPIVSVDRMGVAGKDRVKRALVLVFYRGRVGNIYLTGIGTGIGGLSIEDFIEVLEEVLSLNLKRIDLSEAYMKDIDLSFTDLEEANLVNANLQGADLGTVNLRNANLCGANLQGAYLLYSNLQRANLGSTNMRGVMSHNTNYMSTYLARADLRGGVFDDSCFVDANLQNAYLCEASMEMVNMSSAELKDANMAKTALDNANLSDANLDRADLRGTVLRGAILEGSSLCGIKVSEDTLLEGMCFDALTVREFLEKYNIERKGDKIKLYKGVDDNYTSPCVTSSSVIRYDVGKTYEAELCNFNAGDECGHGLHVCPTKELAKDYGEKVLQVEVDIKDIVAIPRNGSKVRVKKFKILKEVNLDSIRK